MLKNNRLSKALTGLDVSEFQELVPIFEKCLIDYRYKIKPNRKRKLGGGRKGSLATISEKLAYILIYLKVYPTYDVMSCLTDRERSKCCESVQLLLPVLEMALGRKQVLPQRKIRSTEEFFNLFPEVRDVFIDGTERRVQTPNNLKKRTKLYSGKKKSTTRKTIVLSDEKKRVLLLSPTKSGRRHDKQVTDKFHIVNTVPDPVTIWADTGFIGIQHSHPNTVMPAKASKNNPLTQTEKEENRLISGGRVVSEHAICGIKRLKSASDIYRNRLPNLDDTFTLLATGIWNYHIQRTGT
jgi:hypothetical protein